MNCSGLPLVGTFLAVASTVPPPRLRRFTTASPIPFVPPVTRMRLPVNSFASYGTLGVLIIFGSLRCEVVKDNLLRKRQENFLGRLLVDGILRITIQRRFVPKPHDKADVERGV